LKSLAAFQIIGMNVLQSHLARKARDLENRRKINAQAVGLVDRWIMKNFQTEGKLAHPGKGWQPLSEATIAMRRRGPRKERKIMILQDTGTMRSRWKHYWDAWVGKIQSGVDYAYKHHYGQAMFIPPRRILPSQKQIEPDISKLYQTWIKGVLK